jgi:hypothetical protein
MSITPCAIDPRRATQPTETHVADPGEKLRKRVYTGFAASVGIVLVIAVCYVAARVFTGQGSHPRPITTAKVTPKVLPPVHAAAQVVAQVKIQTVAPPLPVTPPTVVKASVPVQAAAQDAAQAKIQKVSPPQPAAPPAIVKASVPAKVQPQSLPAPVPEKPIVPLTLGKTWTTVTPHTGETYLQVIALGGRFVEEYVNGLKAKGLHPLVAVSPLDGIYRIVFGPFKNRPARDAERKDLEAAGLQPMVQVY